MSELELIKILYVEDDLGYARLFKKRMERKGFIVELAKDGEEGLARWNPDLHDVLVLDYKLPVYNGLEFLQRLAEKGAIPPVIMVTGLADAQVAVEAMKLGASDYIIKDANVNYLELMPSVIEQVLHHHDLEQQKKNAEEALRESEERFRLLFEHSNDAIIIHDLQGNIIDINQRTCEILKKESSLLRGMNLRDFYPEDKPGEFDLKLAETRTNGNNLYETQFIRSDGSVVDVEISSRITNEKKGVIQAIVRDITVRKWMEKELVKKNRELNDFAYRISHDLKNPLTLINGFASAIKEDPELFDMHFQKIIDMSNRLIRFIDDLLKLSRAGVILGDKKEIDIEYILREQVQFVIPSRISRELLIEESIPPIIGDSEGIQMVFRNLIENSIKFMDQEKEKMVLKVSWEKRGSFLILCLEDNGKGIRKEYISKVFHPGFTTGKKNSATGFGLAITKKIVDAHGGDIWVSSSGENKGSQFFLKLPLKEQTT